MADVSTPAQQQQQQQAMTKTAKKKQKKSAAGGEAGSSAPPAPVAAASSAASDDRDVRLTERVDMLDRKLKKLDHLADPENQLIINDALRLQRDLLQAGVAVPSKPELVMRSMRESPHFTFCDPSDDSEDEEDQARVREALKTHGLDPANGAAGENGRRSTQESILALLESVATSASAFAHQIHQSNFLNDGSNAVAGRSGAPTTAAERREQRAERKRRVDALLERISQTPINLLFGIRIRRKYAAEVLKRYKFDPQPYFAHLTPDMPDAPQTDSGDCTPDALSAASSDAEGAPGTPPPTAPRTNPPGGRKTAGQQQTPAMRMPRPRTSSSSSDNDHSSSSSLKDRYSASRICGVDPRKTAARLAEKAEAEAATPGASTGGQYATRQTARRTGGPPRHPIAEPPAAKTTRTRNAAGTNRQPVDIGDVNEEELDVLSWMERLKLEQSGGKPTPPHPSTVFNAAEAASSMLQNFMMDVAAKDNMQIPPGAMNILQEALISAARENGVASGEPPRVEEVDRQTARAMANTFMQSAAVLGSNERKARQTAGGSSASSTTSSAAAAAAGALADLPGLTPSTANEVWQEIQGYLQQLYATAQAETRGETSGTSASAKNGVNPPLLGSTIAATLVAAAQNTPGLPDAAVLSHKSARPPSMVPVLEPSAVSGLGAAKPAAATNRAAKKKQKKKNKPPATVSDVQIAEMLAKRREILRLQAEKQREHAAAVAELREHEARLLEAQQRKPKNPKMPYEIRYTRPPPLPPVDAKKEGDAAGSSAAAAAAHPIVPGNRFAPRPRIPSPPAAWLNFMPPLCPPFDIADGPWGKTYVLGPTAVTCHTQWMDRKMIARGMRAYLVIWNIEIRRLHLGCGVFTGEVQDLLDLHCYEHRQGFLFFLTDGKSEEMLAANGERLRRTNADYEARENRVFWRPCVHEHDWGRTMRYERMCGYHKRFIKLDPLLPLLPGDFFFLINQVHYGHHEALADEQFALREYAKSLEHQGCACNRCVTEQQFMEWNVLNPAPPAVPPFSTQKHIVDLHLPMNFVMNQPAAEQLRLCMNQALCSERAIVIPRAPLIEEERRWARAQRQNSSATSKTAESTPPLAEEPHAPTVNAAPEPEVEPKATAKAAAKKRKKRK